MEASFTVTITKEDIDSYSNLGYNVEQKHLDLATELYEEKVQGYFAEDLFDCLLAAKQYIDGEAA